MDTIEGTFTLEKIASGCYDGKYAINPNKQYHYFNSFVDWK